MKIKKIFLSMKHNDLLSVEIMGEKNKTLWRQDEGYMPDLGMFKEGEDQTELTIDNETGKIIGWVPVTKLPEKEEEDND